MLVLLLAVSCNSVRAGDGFGPGSGPWVVGKPEEHGLSAKALGKLQCVAALLAVEELNSYEYFLSDKHTSNLNVAYWSSVHTVFIHESYFSSIWCRPRFMLTCVRCNVDGAMRVVVLQLRLPKSHEIGFLIDTAFSWSRMGKLCRNPTLTTKRQATGTL